MAKNWLTNNDFEFEMVDVSADHVALAFIKERGHTKVPQIYEGDTLLVDGGYTGMINLGAVNLRERMSK